MKLGLPSLEGLSPGRLLQLYLAIVLLTAAGAGAVVFFTSSRMDARSRENARFSHAALEAARVQAGLGEPIQLLADNLFGFMSSQTFRSLPPEAQGGILAAFRGTPSSPASPVEFPLVSIPIEAKDALQFSRSVDFYANEIDHVLAEAEGVDLSSVEMVRNQLLAAVVAYFDDPSASNFDALFMSLTGLSEKLNEASGVLASKGQQGQGRLESSISQARIAALAVLAAFAAIMAAATLSLGAMIQRAFTTAQREREALRGTSETLRYRNNQLSALYNVFAEITDTLSLRYVISATVREAVSLMNANMAVLRLLKGKELVVVGNLTDSQGELAGLQPVPLGEGPTGRAARRGRTVRIDRGAQDQLGPSLDPDTRVESGIVAPLIVGARVVGTLSVWSHAPEAFSVEDERVLEMMASQVATAVVAAETTETSERRAHQDALTGLPNRLQLTEDIAGDLATLVRQGRRAVVAMADIDHFKRFNDDFGHRVGDVTLQQVASVLRHAVRENDRVYRFGGEEFVLVFPDIGPTEALALADRIRNAVASTPFAGDNLEPVGPVMISIGLAALPDHDTDLDNLIELADKAMYRAKDAGRNCVVLWGEAALPSLVA